MEERAKDRLAEIGAMQNALQAAWATLKPYLELRRREHVAKLITACSDYDNNQSKGRIKELDDLLELPERLQQEAASLTAPVQEEGDLP